MPWLMERIEVQLTKSTLGRTVLDVIIREVVQKRCEAYAKLEEVAASVHSSARGTPMEPIADKIPAVEQVTEVRFNVKIKVKFISLSL